MQAMATRTLGFAMAPLVVGEPSLLRVGSQGNKGPDNQGCGSPPGPDAPQFHLQDMTGCELNDPNGPVYDPVHGIYHVMYQDHQAAAPGGGPDYGHWLSRDLVHWTQMPMSIWNGIDVTAPGDNQGYRDTPYDNIAIFTGSAAVVPGFAPDGVSKGVLQIYPGLCKDKWWPGCTGGKKNGTGQVLAVAVPHDYANDPFLTNWTKPDYNPIVPTVQRDPSEPWKTSHGEWRLRTYDGMEYGSASDADMKAGKWYTVGQNPDFVTAECPSYFPLPGASPGFEAEYKGHRSAGTLPNRVQKLSVKGIPEVKGMKDAVRIGTHTDGAPGKLSGFAATPGWEDVMGYQVMDQGLGYAAKDMQAADGRRINWVWLRASPHGVMGLPQEVTFNAALRQLEYAPASEMKQLRGKRLAKLGSTPVEGPMNLGLPKWVGNTSEVEVVFELPSAPATFGVWVMGDANSVGNGTYFSVDYAPAANSSAQWNEVTVSGTSAGQDCWPGCKSTVRLAPSEKTLQLNVFVDNTFAEAFWQIGRTHLTVRTPASKDASVWLDASASVTAQSAEVWAMKRIWISKEEVLATPRVDLV